ncbi:MAG TPA: hypothetical protein VFN99_06250 [Gaiella sp.]|jgi:hypothetical protein|nr:hypothetical protein [Gaiella sp.]
MATVTTPWGKATTLEEVAVPQRAGDKRFTTRVELLETTGGERLVRFSYATDGSVRRGPVTLRERDLAKLRAVLDRAPELQRSLREVEMAG